MNISFALTTRQVRDRIKTETRRNGWKKLAALYVPSAPSVPVVLRGIEKGQGLKKGEHPVFITSVQVVKAWREPLNLITADSVEREGFPCKSPDWFIGMYCEHNGGDRDQEITVIRFTYPWRAVAGGVDFGIIWANSLHDARCAACTRHRRPAYNFLITPVTNPI